MTDSEDEFYDTEHSKLQTEYWLRQIDWSPHVKVLKSELSVRPVSDSAFTRRCFESSFLFRILYRYQSYISRFVLNPTTHLYTPKEAKSPSALQLTNSLTLALEQTVLTDYANSYLAAMPECLAFPPDQCEFLWNFFTFLSVTDAKLNCIIPLEACADVYSAFSSALLLSRLETVPAEQRRLCVFDIARHVDVVGRLHGFFDLERREKSENLTEDN